MFKNFKAIMCLLKVTFVASSYHYLTSKEVYRNKFYRINGQTTSAAILGVKFREENECISYCKYKQCIAIDVKKTEDGVTCYFIFHNEFTLTSTNDTTQYHITTINVSSRFTENQTQEAENKT